VEEKGRYGALFSGFWVVKLQKQGINQTRWWMKFNH
jgi:hypothetical protein